MPPTARHPLVGTEAAVRSRLNCRCLRAQAYRPVPRQSRTMVAVAMFTPIQERACDSLACLAADTMGRIPTLHAGSSHSADVRPQVVGSLRPPLLGAFLPSSLTVLCHKSLDIWFLQCWRKVSALAQDDLDELGRFHWIRVFANDSPFEQFRVCFFPSWFSGSRMHFFGRARVAGRSSMDTIAVGNSGALVQQDGYHVRRLDL